MATVSPPLTEGQLKTRNALDQTRRRRRLSLAADPVRGRDGSGVDRVTSVVNRDYLHLRPPERETGQRRHRIRQVAGCGYQRLAGEGLAAVCRRLPAPRRAIYGRARDERRQLMGRGVNVRTRPGSVHRAVPLGLRWVGARTFRPGGALPGWASVHDHLDPYGLPEGASPGRQAVAALPCRAPLDDRCARGRVHARRLRPRLRPRCSRRPHTLISVAKGGRGNGRLGGFGELAAGAQCGRTKW